MEDKTTSTQLKDLIVEYFTLDEIRELCFTLGIDYENLRNPDATKKGASIALIKKLDVKRLPELVSRCRELRPEVPWPDAPTKLYFEEDLQTEAQLQAALDEYKKYLRGKWEKDPLLDGPLDDFYIWLEGQEPEEKNVKEASSSPETSKDSLPESSSEDSEASKQDQDKKESQYVSYRPPPLGLQEALEKHERLIVLGTAGTGKSTFLRHLVYQKTTNDSNTIPILVSLSDYAKAIENPQPSSKTGLKQWSIETAHEDPTIQAILNSAVEENQVLWLLDGFDETGNQMNKVADAIAQLPMKNQLVLTSRPDALKEHQHRFNATQYEMCDLSQRDHAIEQFLQKRFGNQDKVSDVLEWLTEDSHRQQLTTQPLHLILLATVTKETKRDEWPETRVQLYGKFIDIFSDKRIENEKKKDGSGIFHLGTLKRDEACAATVKGFHCLGWVLFHQEKELSNNNTTPEKQVIDCLKQAGYSNEDAEAILSFWQEAGVQKSFHSSFWPYAAACKLYDDWQTNAESTWQFLSSATPKLPYASRLHHHSWQEPILMLSTLMDKEQLNNLIDRLLRKRDKEERYLHQNLRLAAAIIGEVGNGSLEKKYEEKVIKQLGKLTRDRWYTPIILAGFSILSLIGLFISGILAFFHHYLPLLFFGILAFLWVLLLLPLPWKVRLPRLLRIPLEALWQLITNAETAITYILRSIGLESAHPHIFVTTLSSAGKAAIPELEYTFESRHWLKNKLSYEVVHALGDTGSKEAVPFLSDVMNEGYGHIRLTAADSLRKIDHESATEALIHGIEKDDYIALRGRSSWFPLPSSPFIISSTAVLPLCNALNSDEVGVRWLAAITLGEIGDKRAVPSLISALDDEHSHVIDLAANALFQIGPASIPDLHIALNKESTNNRVRYRIALTLVDLGDFSAVHHLIPYLKEEGRLGIDEIHRVLIQAGKVKGEKAIHQYFRICKLDPHDEETRTMFLDVLEELGLTHTILDLMDSVPYDNIQDFLLDALSVLGEQGIVIPNDYEHGLIHIANNNARKSKWQNVKTIKILGDIGSVAAIPNLLDILNHNQHIFAEITQNPTNYKYIYELIKNFNGNYSIEMATIEALGKIKADDAVQVLTQIITFDNVKVSDAATIALKRDATPSYFYYSGYLKELRVAAAIALKAIGNTATLDLICDVLSKNDNAGRIDAIKALGIIGDAKAVPHLIKILTAANSHYPWQEAEIYIATAASLGLIGNARAVPHLIDIQNKSNDSEIRDASAKALKQIKFDVTDNESISCLIDALGNRREEVYQTAIEKLTQMGNSIVMFLCEVSRNSNDQQIRSRIMDILGNIGDRDAIPLLLEALESNDERTAQEAIKALGKIKDFKDAEYKKLVEVINDEEKSYLHAETAVTLGQLAPSISDENTLESARKALWKRRFKENIFTAYEKVVTSLTIVQVRELPQNNKHLSSASATKISIFSHIRDQKWLLLFLTAVLLVAIETLSGFFADILGSYLPSGIAGIIFLAILVLIIILLIGIDRYFDNSR